MTIEPNMKFFIDPLSDPMVQADKIYVTEERIFRNLYIDKIVEVKSKPSRHGNRLWRITDPAEDHVAGPAVNSEDMEYNSPVIGWRNGQEGQWGVGRFLGTRNGRALIGSHRRADRKQIAVNGNSVENLYEQADVWFPAAEWAMELMPEGKDSDAVVEAKMALAEQRWTQRKAKITLMIESMARNYSQLDTLITDGDMPEPVFGALFIGTVLVPAGRAPAPEQRTVAAQRQIEALQARLGTTVDPGGMFMAMRVESVLPLKANGRTGIDTTKVDTVRDAIQTKLNDYNVRVSDYTLSPILRAVRTADVAI